LANLVGEAAAHNSNCSYILNPAYNENSFLVNMGPVWEIIPYSSDSCSNCWVEYSICIQRRYQNLCDCCGNTRCPMITGRAKK